MTLPYSRSRRCAASRRKRATNSRISSGCPGKARLRDLSLFVRKRFRDEEVRETPIGVEADDPFGIGDEIGKSVDVVIEEAAARLVRDVFNAADLDAGQMHDALDSFKHFGGRRVGFHVKSIFRGVHRTTRPAFEFFAGGALADVAGAEVVGFSLRANLDGVEIFSAEDFDAGDDAVARGETFLDEGGVVHAKA